MERNPLSRPKRATAELLTLVSGHAFTPKSLNEQMHNANAPIEIAILIDDQELIRLVASWPKLSAEERGNLTAISEIANIPRSRIEAILRRARAHKLVFDDGTINPVAEKVIMSMVGQRLAETMDKINRATDSMNKKPDRSKSASKSKNPRKGKK